MVEVAGQGINTAKGLRENGIDASMVVWKENNLADSSDAVLHIDFSIKKDKFKNIIKMLLFTIKSFFCFDVFHIHSGCSLTPYCFELYFLKFFRKKLFAEFHGSDIRFLFNHDIKYAYFNEEPAFYSKYKKRAERIINNADGIILHDYELDAHLPKEIKKSDIYHVPLRVKVNEIKVNYPDKTKEDKPIIVHAPSSRSKKGTNQILAALKKVKSEYELVLVEGKTHDEAMEIYSKADIVIDQISLGTYGVFAIEAMAMGKPVITYMSDDMIERMPDTLPIISSDFDSLPSVVEKLINDPQLRYNKGALGRKYVERYHDYKKVTALLSKIYLGNIENNDLFQLL